MNARTRAPHAEIAEIWPRDGAIKIIGDLRGGVGSASGRWHLVAILRETDTRLVYDLSVAGTRFDVSVPVADFVPADPVLPADGLRWDLYTAPEDRLDLTTDDWLRVGRHLDDIRDKKKIMVFPLQQAEVSGVRATVQPFYTVYDNISVHCAPCPSH